MITKRLIIHIIMFSFPFVLNAQRLTEIRDTIFVGKEYITFLTFSDDIIDGDYGNTSLLTSPDGNPVTETYNEEGYSSLKVKARKKFEKTNIIVLVKGGIAYDLIVIYKESPTKFLYQYGNFNIAKKPTQNQIEDSSNEDEFWTASADGVIEEQMKEIQDLKATYDTIPYQNTARLLFSSQAYNKSKYRKIVTHNKGIYLGLENSWIMGDYMYFKFFLENTSDKSFDITNWNFKSAPYRAYNKMSSSGRYIKPVYEFKNDVKEVAPNKKVYKIFVFKNFSIPLDEFFYVRIGDNDAQKEDLELGVPEKPVNHPTWIGDNKIKRRKKEKNKED